MIAGVARGRRLAVPGGQQTRPTSDRAREGLFGTVISLTGTLTGLRVLDLYAGSGAVGLEALSRGAAQVTFVESAGPAIRAIRANIDSTGLPGAELVADRVDRFLARRPSPAASSGAGPYDLVFADPPYAMSADAVTALLDILKADGFLASGALIVIERATRSGDLRWPAGYQPARSRRYGEATFWYGHAQDDLLSEHYAEVLDDE